ncbi:ubiquitin-specific protease otu1 [Elasticomyces elasticus]|nr:ubiquitin-specific protease otu1 [Elasticomyces elasticus]
MRLRVRGPSGAVPIALPDFATWGELLSLMSEKTSVPDFDIKYGYPPRALDTTSISASTKLTDVGIRLDGEQLTIIPRDIQAELQDPLAHSKADAMPDPAKRKPLPKTKDISPPKHRPNDYPPTATPPLSLSRKPNDVESDPPEVPVPSLEGTLILRVMPDDNSCMFRALGSAVLGGSLDSMTELRGIVAQTIQAQPDLYNKAMLEKEPDAYCAWIQREDAWGGGIELSILSGYFDIEICSLNVQDLRIDRFNEGRPTRCILVYSGIHYDVLALSPSAPPHAHSDNPPEFDRKVFDVVRVEGVEEDGGVLEAARELCKVLQSRHYFTDTHGFAIKCNKCGWTGKGEKDAVAHAQETGHYDFGEAG